MLTSLALVGSAYAGLQTWVQRGAFVDVVPGYHEITFGEAPAPVDVDDQYEGLRFTDGDDYTWFDTQYGGDFLILIGNGSVTIEFDRPVTAFAIRFPFVTRIEAYDAAGNPVGAADAAGPDERSFFGITSAVAFSRILLRDGVDNVVVLDNLWWGDVDAGRLPDFAIGGTCASTLDFTLGDLTPRGPFAIVRSAGAGRFAIPSGGCAGTALDLAGAGISVAYTGRADAQGAFTARGVTLQAAVCGQWLQVVDLDTCAVTPARRLP